MQIFSSHLCWILENYNEQSRSSRSRSKKVFPESSKAEQALCAESASFRTIINRAASTAGRQTNSAAIAADLNPWVLRLDKMTFDVKHAGISNDQNRNTSMRSDSSVSTISKEEVRSLIQIKVNLVVEIAHREEMKNKSGILVEEFTCAVSATGYCAATKGIKIIFLGLLRVQWRRRSNENSERDVQPQFQSLVTITHFHAGTGRGSRKRTGLYYARSCICLAVRDQHGKGKAKARVTKDK